MSSTRLRPVLEMISGVWREVSVDDKAKAAGVLDRKLVTLSIVIRKETERMV